MYLNAFKYVKNFKKITLAQTKPIISIENVVATGKVNQSLDLTEIAAKFSHAEYEPDRFPGLVFRLTSPKTSTLIFRTGNMVCTGSRAEDQANIALNTVVKKLRANKIKVKGKPLVKVQNIVASVARQLPRSMYEPEQFPGVILRVSEPRAVFLVFSSGKLVCTGAKKEEDIFAAVNKLHATLEERDLMIY